MNMFTQLNPDTEFIISEKASFAKDITFGKNCKKVTIGYGASLGSGMYIDVPELIIGDYTTIQRDTTIHGYEPCKIGHNCWIGQFCIIDSIGGTTIGNNVGVGAHSQLWSHIKFGDTLEGCRWNGSKPLIVEDDVWFVGHCIVSPITAKKKSMLMVGSVAVKDMEANRIYSGSPAKDMTDKLGNQFNEVTLGEKVEKFTRLYEEFLEESRISKDMYPIHILREGTGDKVEDGITVFNIDERTYYPTRSEYEYKFMKYLLYDKAKFIPNESVI